jgi:hypothetical protein
MIMAEEKTPDLLVLSTPQRPDTLSVREQKWFSDWFTVIDKNQQAIGGTLRTINTAVQIIAVLMLISAVLGGCQLLLQ